MIAVLFARADSIYKTMPECDVYDIERDAMTFRGGMQIVAHPPCRAWGRLRQWALARPGEKELGRYAVAMVRRYGGILEHPESSTLYDACGLPRPGRFPDEFGGYSIVIDQFNFGHRAEKRTWLYIVGCQPDELPAMPMREGKATHCVRPTKSYPRLPSITKREREATPEALAKWLVQVAQLCRKNDHQR